MGLVYAAKLRYSSAEAIWELLQLPSKEKSPFGLWSLLCDDSLALFKV